MKTPDYLLLNDMNTPPARPKKNMRTDAISSPNDRPLPASTALLLADGATIEESLPIEHHRLLHATVDE